MIRKRILAETSAEAEQLQLKRARLVLNLNDKGAHRPGPMEPIHKHIPPVHSSIKQDMTGCQEALLVISASSHEHSDTQFLLKHTQTGAHTDASSHKLQTKTHSGIHRSMLPGTHTYLKTEITKASGEKSSRDDRLLPEPSGNHSPLSLVPLPYPPEKLAGRTIPSLTQIPPLSESFLSLELTNGAKEPNQSTKSKANLSCSAHTHKKHMHNGPKIKKLKYHQYIPPEQKGDKQPPPVLDSSYTQILRQQQQQQLFLQLQILSEQQQHDISHPILPTPSKPMKDQLNEMKVAQLKSELKLRSLPVYGNKNDLVGRLRAYEVLNGGCDITSSATAGGTAGPVAGGARTSSKTASPNTTSQQLFQRSSITPQPADASSSATPPRTTQQLMTCSGTVSLPPISLIPFVQCPAAKRPEHSSFSSDPLGEMISSPLTLLSIQACSVSRLPTDIKEEHSCSTPTPFQVSLNPASLHKLCPGSSAAHTTRTTAPVLTVDKDKMLQEKDKQIEELTRELRQKQKLVEVLKMQLEIGKRGGRVKQESPDVPLSYGHSPLSAPPSSMDATKRAVKQEAAEAEEVVSETTLRSPDTRGQPQLLTQEAPKPIQLQLQTNPEPIGARTGKEQRDCLQQATLQPTQQQAAEKLLLPQRHNIQNYNGTLENRQHLQKSRKQHGQSKRHLQQIQLKQQTSSLKQQIKVQQLINQPQQIQIQIKLKQQQVLIQKNPQLQQVSDDSNPTLLTDSNSNHFLIELTSHVTEKQRTNALKATNYLPLQAHNAGVQVSVDQQRAAAQCLSAPPGLKPFFQAPSGKNTLSPSSQTDTEAKDDFIDLILQTKEPDLSLDCLSPNSSTFCSSPLQLLQSPLTSPSCDTAQLQSEPESLVDPTEEEPHHSNTGSGCMEDFLQSTMEKPLLGEEPGGLLVLIDDFHSQMLCTPSLLDDLPSPMDTFHMVAEAEQKLNFNDWLDLTMGGDTHEETPTLAPLGPQTPCGIFSADFLDNYIME